MVIYGPKIRTPNFMKQKLQAKFEEIENESTDHMKIYRLTEKVPLTQVHRKNHEN